MEEPSTSRVTVICGEELFKKGEERDNTLLL